MQLRSAVIWAGVAALMAGPVALAALSPYLAYRSAVYILGGFAGILALALLLPQPLLAAGYLPGVTPGRALRWHRRVGAALVACVAVHVGGLYLTSPMDTLDVLLLRAPTPFSVHGFLAMWGVILTVGLVAMRRRVPLWLWRWLHNGLALGVVITTSIHAARIEGAMEPVSKFILLAAVLGVTVAGVVDLRVIRTARRG